MQRTAAIRIRTYYSQTNWNRMNLMERGEKTIQQQQCDDGGGVEDANVVQSVQK